MGVLADVAIGPSQVIEGTVIRIVAPGPSLVTVMEEITDASETNPYLIEIGAGVHTLEANLKVKRYVHLRGAGPDVTIITGSYGNDTRTGSALVELDSGYGDILTTSVRHLSIRNDAAGNFSTTMALAVFNDSYAIEHVQATSTGGTMENVGIYLGSSATVPGNLFHTLGRALGNGTENTGIWTLGFSGDLVDCHGVGEGDNAINSGLRVNSISVDLAQARAHGGRYRALGDGSTNSGVKLAALAFPLLEGTEAEARGDNSSNCGVEALSSSVATTEASSLVGFDSSGTGSGAAVCLDSSSAARVRRSTLHGSSSTLKAGASTSVFGITQSTLIPGSIGTVDAPADYTCLYSNQFSGRIFPRVSGEVDSSTELDTDCDNSN